MEAEAESIEKEVAEGSMVRQWGRYIWGGGVGGRLRGGRGGGGYYRATITT